MISITINDSDFETIHQVQNHLLNLPRSIKKAVLGKMAKRVIAMSQTRTRLQYDLRGVAYASHARHRRRKMLVRLAKRLKVVSATEDEAVIAFNTAVEGEIGYKQQFGASEVVNKSQFNRLATASYDSPSTRRQAKSLIEAGYKVKPAGGAYRTPTIKWITQNLTVGRAGSILRLIRNRGLIDSWITTLPARSFLGVTENEKKELVRLILEESIKLYNDGLQA